MECYEIKEGINFCNLEHPKRWLSRIVLIPKKLVVDVNRSGGKITFELDGKGHAFEYYETSDVVMGNAEAVKKFDYTQYRHNVQVPFVSFLNYELMNDIARGECFAAIMDVKKRVWIFGFDYTLRMQDAAITHIQNDVLTLRSDDSGLENDLPLRYYSLDPEDDFMNDFDSLPIVELGEFSDDFNDDFNN